MPHRVLLVDDEPNVTQGLRRSLRNEPCEVRIAASAAEGLEILAREKIDVVISDENMPGMHGTEFLSRVREAYPEVIRILLTGHATVLTALKAINDGEIYRLLLKPCSDLELITTLRQVFEIRDIQVENQNLKSMVRRQYELLRDLEARHPGISRVTRNRQGEVVIPEESSDLATQLKKLGES